MKRFVFLLAIWGRLGIWSADFTYDDNGVRYQLVNTLADENWNWIFIPGGPGCDSSSLFEFTQLLDLPGNSWLIDFPGNGSNAVAEDYAYDQWFDCVVPMVKRFENPIIVGFSFGGVITLLTPELEKHLKAVVIVSSTPRLWIEEAAACARKYNLPDFNPQLLAFVYNPTEETARNLLDVCSAYYFYREMEKGRALIHATPYAFNPAFWWMNKIAASGYTATWVPKSIPALIIGNAFDFMTPFELFQKDERFLRSNIQLVEIEEAGHFNWIDNPEAVKSTFESFKNQIAG